MTAVRLHLALDRDAAETFVQRREKFTTFSLWTVVETTTALICANLPPMTTMLRRTYNKIVSSVGLPITSGSGSGSGFARSGEKKGSDSYSHPLPRQRKLGTPRRHRHRSGLFDFSWVYGPRSHASSTANSRSAAHQSMMVSSVPSVVYSPAAANVHNSSRALRSIGVKTETIIDIEKAECASLHVDEIKSDGSMACRENGSRNGHGELRQNVSMDGYLPPSVEALGKVRTTVTGSESG